MQASSETKQGGYVGLGKAIPARLAELFDNLESGFRPHEVDGGRIDTILVQLSKRHVQNKIDFEQIRSD